MIQSQEKYYRDWAQEYLSAAENIKQRIREKKQKAKETSSPDSSELLVQIQSMTGSYLDCMYIARILSGHADREAAKIKEVKAWS